MRSTVLWIGVIVVAVACRNQPPQDVAAYDRWECPHDWQWNRAPVGAIGNPTQGQKGGLVVPSGQLSGPGDIQKVPEFHDCQRFLVPASAGPGLEYGELFAIFAAFHLDRLDSLERAQLGLQIPGFGADVGVAAVEIAAWGDYPPLYIERGFNCLYVYHREGSWQAKMVSHGPEEQDCSDNVQDPEGLVGDEMQVIPYSVPDFESDDYEETSSHYPRVARWDWDRTHRQHFIGVKCGKAWCEIGNRDDFDPSSSPPAVAKDHYPPHWQSLSIKERRVYEVKGWYDEQHLASVPGGIVQPTSVLGRLFPHEALGEHDKTAFDRSWIPVAYVSLEERQIPGSQGPVDASNPGGYGDRLNFELTPPIVRPKVRLGTIFLCRGDRDACGIRPNVSGDCHDPGEEEWWGTNQRYPPRPDHPAKQLCVKYRSIPPLTVPLPGTPGTVRWRWLAQVDEGGWVWCPEGCCEETGGG